MTTSSSMSVKARDRRGRPQFIGQILQCEVRKTATGWGEFQTEATMTTTPPAGRWDVTDVRLGRARWGGSGGRRPESRAVPGAEVKGSVANPSRIGDRNRHNRLQDYELSPALSNVSRCVFRRDRPHAGDHPQRIPDGRDLENPFIFVFWLGTANAPGSTISASLAALTKRGREPRNSRHLTPFCSACRACERPGGAEGFLGSTWPAHRLESRSIDRYRRIGVDSEIGDDRRVGSDAAGGRLVLLGRCARFGVAVGSGALVAGVGVAVVGGVAGALLQPDARTARRSGQPRSVRILMVGSG